MISADILLKGLGGLAVVGGAATVGIFYLKQNKTEDLKSLAEKVGLVCSGTPTETNGIECSKGTGDTVKVKVKRDSDSFDATSITGGKIKAYEDKTYNKGFKFVIEEADISVTATAAGSTSKKLEEFETYEIKEDDSSNKELRLTKKTDVNAGIKKALGLPEGTDCDLPTTADIKTCTLDDAKFKKIKFEGGDEERGTVPADAKLKISKVEGNEYGEKYKFKFVLESGQETKISKTVTIKKGTNTEFKIKTNPASGGTKTLTLEKAWTLETLGAKVGLKECGNATSGTPKECGFTSAKLNLFNDANTHAKSASLTSTDATKKIKAEEDQPGYNQGFKFYVTDADLALNNGNNGKKIHKKETNNIPTYEIKEQTPSNGTKDWYLSKVTTAPAS